MGRAIFISYRRDDSEGEAGRLYDDLVRAFGENAAFMDVDGISPGVDFRKAIDENVSGCGVLLAMIGPDWCTLANDSGQRRLDDTADFVRLEIASALSRNIAVIPVLVHDARMPRPEHLPENLKDLAYRNAVELTHARWNSDVQLLIHALQKYVAPSSATNTHPVHAAVPVQLPPPAAVEEPAPAPRRSPLPAIVVAIVTVVVIGLSVVLYFRVSPDTVASAPPTGTGQQSTVAAVPSPAAPIRETASNSSTAQPVAPASAEPDTDTGETRAKQVKKTEPGGNQAIAGRSPLHPNLYAGSWVNPSPEPNNGLIRIQITVDNDSLIMHGWGNCGPKLCDWGAVPGKMNVYRLEAAYEFRQNQYGGGSPARVATVSVFPVNGQLNVMITNTFANRPAASREFNFVRAQ